MIGQLWHPLHPDGKTVLHNICGVLQQHQAVAKISPGRATIPATAENLEAWLVSQKMCPDKLSICSIVSNTKQPGTVVSVHAVVNLHAVLHSGSIAELYTHKAPRAHCSPIKNCSWVVGKDGFPKRQTIKWQPKNERQCSLCFTSQGIDKTMYLSTCKNPNHKVCRSCLQRVLLSPNCLSSEGVVQCVAMFTGRKGRCPGFYNLEWCNTIVDPDLASAIRLRAQTILQRGQPGLQNSKPNIVCTTCGSQASLIYGTTTVVCNRYPTSHVGCMWCLGEGGHVVSDDTKECSCKEDPSLNNAPNIYFGGIRNKDLDADVVKQRIAFLEEQLKCLSERSQPASPLVVFCGSCNTALQKTRACNQLVHCSTAICYFCGASAYPWKPDCMPGNHWQTCDRFDEPCDKCSLEEMCVDHCLQRIKLMLQKINVSLISHRRMEFERSRYRYLKPAINSQ